MELPERLAVFFERLQAAPPAREAEEAFALVCRLIEEIEDEFCPMPREEPPPKRSSGRMYALKADSVVRLPFFGAIHATTAGHQIVCAPDGSIVISQRRKPLHDFRKPGAGK